MAGLPWRRWNVALHRDLGYLAAGLTIVYAVSGIAVNHVNDWNANYAIARETRHFEPVPVSDRDTMVAALVQRLALPGPPKDAFRPSPERVELFYEGWSVRADATAGVAEVEVPRERFGLKAMNDLHLNRFRGAWTWVADAFAIVLAFLALSGLFILRGRQGLLGRGKWFTIAGIAVPLAWIWIGR